MMENQEQNTVDNEITTRLPWGLAKEECKGCKNYQQHFEVHLGYPTVIQLHQESRTIILAIRLRNSTLLRTRWST